MKIVSWNCLSGFNGDKKKYKKIRELDADIYIIQEFNPSKTDEEYNEFIKNHIPLEQYGTDGTDGRTRGMAIIAKEGIDLKVNEWPMVYHDFLSVRVKDKLDIVSVWTHMENSNDDYLNRTIKYLEDNEKNFKNSDNLIMCGDFNLDLAQDNMKDKDKFVRILDDYGYKSIYHQRYNEKFGEESIKTHFDNYGEFYIDYLFAKPELISSFEVGSKEEYCNPDNKYSDHVPLIFEVDL